MFVEATWVGNKLAAARELRSLGISEYRQVFFKAPDFLTNYLTIQQHTTTYEPGIGFFLRF